MPSDLIVLEEAPDIYMCPLFAFTATYVHVALCFGTRERDSLAIRRICCLRRNITLQPEIPPLVPMLFEVVGQIAVEECFLTARGLWPDAPANTEPMASCWIEARPHEVSRTYWRSLRPTIRTIGEYIPGRATASRLIATRPDGSVRLQVIWQGRSGQSIAHALPVFDEAGNRDVPQSISEVPFGVAVHAVFSLDYYHNRALGGPRILFASLMRLIRA